MRILITGATGAMGYYLAEYIKSEVSKDAALGQVYLFGVGRRDAGDVGKFLDGYERLNLFWQPINAIEEVISRVKPDVIFHLAALARVRESFTDPIKYANNNTNGTVNLLQAIANTGLKPKFILASSSEVYGNVPRLKNPICENESMRPVNPYAVTKCCQEVYAQYYSSAFGLPLVITRAFGYINPRRDDLVATAIAKQFVKCERGLSREVFHGDLTPVRSFCDVRDIAAAYWLAVEHFIPAGASRVFNIGSSEPCSIESLVSIIKSLSTAKPTMRKLESLSRPTDIFYAVPDVFNFRRLTRWKQRYSLEQSLIWLMAELRK